MNKLLTNPYCLSILTAAGVGYTSLLGIVGNDFLNQIKKTKSVYENEYSMEDQEFVAEMSKGAGIMAGFGLVSAATTVLCGAATIVAFRRSRSKAR
jgi:hypothetical protein